MIYREHKNNEHSVVKKHFIFSFIKRNHLKLKQAKRNKKGQESLQRNPDEITQSFKRTLG